MNDRHILTPAAVSDDVSAPREPHQRERQLLLAVAIAASLPRVLWGLSSDAMRFFADDGYGQFGVVFDVLQYGGLLIDIGLLVLLGLLHPLDRVVPNTNGKRVAAIAFGGGELCLSFLPLGGFVFGLLGPLGFLAFTVPSLVASLTFAVWLAAILKHGGRSSMLVGVLVGGACIQTLGHVLFSAPPLLSTAIGVVTAIEVLRARRALE